MCCNLAYTAENRYTINDSSVFITSKPLTGRWIKGFKAAQEAIVYSKGKCPGSCLGAAIFNGNRLLATGFNTKTKTKPHNVVIKTDGTGYSITTHAEQAAVDKVKYIISEESYNSIRLIMYVVRLNAFGKFVCSKPCNMCRDYIKQYGIKTVRFINDNGLPEEMTL